MYELIKYFILQFIMLCTYKIYHILPFKYIYINFIIADYNILQRCIKQTILMYYYYYYPS